jgi:thiol-disulfide isomerase/thioredoxin
MLQNMHSRIIPLSQAILYLAMCPFGWAQESAPSLILRGTNGREHTLKQFRGRVVVLNFWATWCAPCLDEMPILTAVYKRYSSSGLVVLGASLDDAKNVHAVDAAARKYKIDYPIYINVSAESMESFGVESVPATILLDRDGRIIARMPGEVDQFALKREIDALLFNNQNHNPAHSSTHSITGDEKPVSCVRESVGH